MGRIEVGSWSDTCQEACRLPSGQGFRWLKARTVPEGSGWGLQGTAVNTSEPKTAVGAGGLSPVVRAALGP